MKTIHAFSVSSALACLILASPATAQDAGDPPVGEEPGISALLFTEEADLDPVEGEGLSLQFNKVVNWQQRKTRDSNLPNLEFTSGEPMTLSCELFFDTYETGESVRTAFIDALTSYTKVVEEKKRPPICTFVWGQKFPPFKCVIESLSIKYTLFLADGTPVRAECSLQLKEADDKDDKKAKETKE